ncbi:hypothetical protein DFH08DRAFT_896216 [Mycena albidolilacea]|uniref:Transmembrane protein n=1 Tax=Mycena albidolilacea TaxID=1033008 RepID=A0AAD6ZA71_9AGAR|nr:hypothetical protein DFH08DRAFT_896216 [Mycena albidolilacea]
MALWNFTIPDTSSMLSYHPYADGFGLQNGWQTWYTVSGFNAQAGESSKGDSFHLTSLPGAELSLQFYGSAVYLHGTANASYEVTLDDNIQSFSGAVDLLYSNEGLIEENHLLTLKAKPSNTTQQIGVSRVVVSGSQQQVPTQVFYDNSDGAFSYTGNWTTSTVQGIPNSSVTAPFHQTLDAGASVKMNFSSAVAVALYGSTNFGHGLYSVALDNGVPQIYNASTFWLVTNTVVFFQSGLDSKRTYTVNVVNMSPGAKLTLSSVVTYQVDQPSNSTTGSGSTMRASSSHGATVGKIVGPILGVLVLGLLIAAFWLRSRRSRANHAPITPLVLSPNEGEPNTDSEMTQTRIPPRRKGEAPWPRPAPPPSPPLTSHGSTMSPTGSVNVDQIIEIIAQRIDRREDIHGSESHLPPDYHSV